MSPPEKIRYRRTLPGEDKPLPYRFEADALEELRQRERAMGTRRKQEVLPVRRDQEFREAHVLVR